MDNKTIDFIQKRINHNKRTIKRRRDKLLQLDTINLSVWGGEEKGRCEAEIRCLQNENDILEDIMRIETNVYYDEEDFENYRDEMNIEECLNKLEYIKRGYFNYNYPGYEGTSESNFDSFKCACALRFAIDKLKELEENK